MSTVRLAETLPSADELEDDQREAMYALWMTTETPSREAVVAFGQPWLASRVRRTLVAGTPEQRVRAADLLATGFPDVALDAVRRAHDHAERVGPPAASEALSGWLENQR